MKSNKTINRIFSLLLALVIAAAYAPALALPAYAADSGELSLEFIEDKTEFIQGEPINIKASGDPNGMTQAWVGLYRRGETPGSGIYSLRWYYVGNHEDEIIDISAKEWEGDRKENVGPGEYTLFLFNDGEYSVETSYDFTIAQDPNYDPGQLSMELADNTTTFLDGEPVYVKASGDPNGTAQAWVGLYKKGEEPGSGIYSLRWYYVASYENQKANLVDPVNKGDRNDPILPGEYTVFLFGSNDYDVVKSIDITIAENPNKEKPEPADELSLAFVDPNKTTYKLGEEVKIKATGIADHAWVGLYNESDAPSESVPALRWYYIQDGYNGVKVNIMSSEFMVNNTSPITEGDYKILLYDADNYDNIVEELHFKIEGIIDINPDDFTLEVEKTLYMYKEQIRVKASGMGIGNAAWVGLYPADTQTYTGAYLYYYYTKEANGVWTVIQNWHKGSAADRFLGDGNYKFVIFADGGYNYPIKSVEFTIYRELKYRKVLREPGCVTLGLEYVTYEDDTSEYRAVPTLGGHLWGKAIKKDGTGKHTFICERNEDHVKTEACSSEAPGKVTKAATASEAGIQSFVCDVCGGTYTKEIPALKAPTLTAGRFVYNGKKQTPEVNSIVDAKDEPIPADMYDITYPAKSKAVGSYTVKVTFKGKYAGTYKLTYKIVPQKVKLKKLKKSNKAFTATWKKAAAQTTGYQVAYSRKKDFSGAKYKKVKGIKKISKKIGKLKGGKKYYVKVRAYKVVSGKKYYSEWSNVKAVKTLKK